MPKERKERTHSSVVTNNAPQKIVDTPSNSSSSKSTSTTPQLGYQGIQFNKDFGQHILKNPLVIDQIIEKSAIRSTDVVLEIGPGTGNLTVKLLQRAKKVVAIEVDPRMVVELKKRVQDYPELNSKLQIIHEDFMKLESLPYFDLCIANVPYQISSGIVFKLLAYQRFRCAMLMFQREFAERLTAQPKSNMWCRLSSNAQLLAKCEHIMKISKNSFKPPPKVDSSIVRIEPRFPPPPINYQEWDGLTRICFGTKNKTLTSILYNKNILELLLKNYKTYCALQSVPMDASVANAKNDVEQCNAIRKILQQILEQLNLTETRPAKMDNDDLLRLLTSCNENKLHFA